MSAEIDPEVASLTDALLALVGEIQSRDERTAGRMPTSAVLVYAVTDEQGKTKWDYKYTLDLDCLTVAAWGEALHDIEMGRFLDTDDEGET